MTNKHSPNIMLAFDFGKKRIGVAIGQTVTQSARPLTTLNAKNGVPDWQIVTALVTRWQPDAMIVGVPFNMDGTPQPLTNDARAFVKALQTQYEIPVYEVDERLTTKSAKEQLFSTGGYSALQSGQVDQVAAQLILENWFQIQGNAQK